MPVPSMGLLRSLRSVMYPQQCLRASLSTSCRRAVQKEFSRTPEQEADFRTSFRAQMYESMADRVKRERDEARRTYTEEPLTAFGFLLSFGTVTLATAIIAFTMGWSGPFELNPNSTLPLEQVDPLDRILSRKPHAMEAAWIDLCLILGHEYVDEMEDTRRSHAQSDWSSYDTPKDEIPGIVCYPATTQQVSEIMTMLHKRHIPVTAYSGGTSLEGHFAATRKGVCIDFSRMDQVLKLHKEDLDVVVQPAVGWQDLNEELEKDGLFFPPDPGPGAMIGGMVGTGCSGTNAYRYGTMKEWVVSLTVVLADGKVIKTRQRPRKSSAGYDLTRVFIGSEGTLGLITEATLKVIPRPKSESVAAVSFKSVRDAAQCVFKVVGEGVQIAAVELLDDKQMQCINDAGATERVWKETPYLFFKFGGTPGAVKEQIDIVKRIAKAQGSQSFDFARNKDEAAELWSARKEALWSVMAKRRDESDHVWTTDVAVPISRLPDIIEQTKDDISSSGLLATIVGHVGDGNFHAIILFNDKERKTAEDVVHRMVERAIEMEGTATGEHGVGMVKRDALVDELGQTTVDAMRKVR